MSDTVELHGWTDLSLPTVAMLTLSSRAFKMLGYYLFRQRSDDHCVPGIRRIAQDLQTSEEKWSESTVKRTNEELEEKGWISRVRRGVGKNSATHVFRTPRDKEDWERRQLTSDPSVSSPMTRQSAHPRADSRNTQKKEDSEGSVTAPKSSRPRNLLFDTVAQEGFGIENLEAITDGGRIARISTWLKKQMSAKPEAEIIAAVKGFYTWWENEFDRINPPRDLGKFQEHWASYQRLGGGTKQGQPSAGPAEVRAS